MGRTDITSLMIGPKGNVFSWLPVDEIEDGTFKQIENLAALPPTVHVAVMPDAHKGYGMPIGTALATKKAVVPYAVGVDIGCGMIAVQTSLHSKDFSSVAIRRVLERILEKVPVGQPSRENRNAGAFADRQDSSVLRSWSQSRVEVASKIDIRERAERQVGTLGGGNHFIELQADQDDFLWLMLHTGSRSFGKAICDHYHKIALKWCERYYTALPDKDLAFIALDSEDGRDYMIDMGFAMRFAEESRARIEMAARGAMIEVLGGFTVLHHIETHHNFAAVEKHLGQEVVVHRKGAVSTAAANLVTIPGSMQTGSYIGRAIPNVLSLNTCSHGAGRRLGRNQAKRERDDMAPGYDVREAMQEQGIEIVTPAGSDITDEGGFAYKNIENVMALQSDLVSPVYVLRPLGVVKG